MTASTSPTGEQPVEHATPAAVPEEAVTTLRNMLRAVDQQQADPTVPTVAFEDIAETAVRAIAEPLLAAERRRLANDLTDRLKGYMSELPAGAVEVLDEWWWAAR